MRRSIVCTAWLAFCVSASAPAATVLHNPVFPDNPVGDDVLASVRGGSGFSASSAKLVYSGVWQQLAIMRVAGNDVIDNWWSDRILDPARALRF